MYEQVRILASSLICKIFSVKPDANKRTPLYMNELQINP